MGSGSGGPLGPGMIRQIIISYLYVALWIVLSAAVIMYNKWVLYYFGFPYPLALTMFHMAFCSSLAFIIVRVLKIVKPLNMSSETYIRQVVPIGLLYAASLWFSNSAYLYLSVAFIQMLKALMPVAVYSCGIMLKKEVFHGKTMLNMVFITIGVAIASYGELNFVPAGVMMQLAAVVTEATRLMLVQILITGKGMQMNPITTLYYISPCSFVFLTVPFFFIEYPQLLENPSWHFDPWIFVTNALVAFALNIGVYLLIGKTSALTMNVAGVVKDWILIALSTYLFQAPISALNLFGYGLAFLGVCIYNAFKLQAMKQQQSAKKAAETDEEKGKLLGDGQGSSKN